MLSVGDLSIEWASGASILKIKSYEKVVPVHKMIMNSNYSDTCTTNMNK